MTPGSSLVVEELGFRALNAVAWVWFPARELPKKEKKSWPPNLPLCYIWMFRALTIFLFLIKTLSTVMPACVGVGRGVLIKSSFRRVCFFFSYKTCLSCTKLPYYTAWYIIGTSKYLQYWISKWNTIEHIFHLRQMSLRGYVISGVFRKAWVGL